MSRYPWEKDFKMTLAISQGVELINVSVEGDSVELLKEQIDELILNAVKSDGEYFVEMLIEEDGEYYDSDEQMVRVCLLEKKVLYGGSYEN